MTLLFLTDVSQARRFSSVSQAIEANDTSPSITDEGVIEPWETYDTSTTTTTTSGAPGPVNPCPWQRDRTLVSPQLTFRQRKCCCQTVMVPHGPGQWNSTGRIWYPDSGRVGDYEYQ